MKIMVVCTGNSARFQMAEGWFRHLATSTPGLKVVEVESAGFTPKRLNPLAVEAMREVGIDISHHTSKALADLPSLKGYDDVFTVCAQAEEACPVFPGKTTRLFWPHVDPATATGSEPEKLETLRRVRDLIGERARGFLAGLAG